MYPRFGHALRFEAEREKAMDKEQRRVAKAQLVALMQTGQAWQTAAAQAGLQISQLNAYRLFIRCF